MLNFFGYTHIRNYVFCHLQLGPQILKFDLLVGVHSWVELKCAETMEPGGQSVMICLGPLTPAYFAELWDLIELCVLHTFSIPIHLALEVVTIAAHLNVYAFHSLHLSDPVYSFPP